MFLFGAATAVVGLMYLVAPFVYKQCALIWEQWAYISLHNTFAYIACGTIVVVFVVSFFIFMAPSRRHLSSSKQFYFRLTAYICLIFLLLIGALHWMITNLNRGTPKLRAADQIATVQQISLAARLYFEDHGIYPQKLDTLASVYLPSVPQPISGEPYLYAPLARGAGYVVGAKLLLPKSCSYIFEERHSDVLGDDIDGIVSGVACDDPVYCLVGP